MIDILESAGGNNKTTIKRLKLLPEEEEITYEVYKVVEGKGVGEVIEEVFRPIGRERQAIEGFLEEVIEQEP